MFDTSIKVRLLDPRFKEKLFQPPSRATNGSAAFDLRLMSSCDMTIYPNETIQVSSGIALSIEDSSVCAIILPRSGLGSKGIILANAMGLIDSDYQGPLLLNLWNRGKEPFTLSVGERVAQLVFLKMPRVSLDFVENFTGETPRACGGFGSTGKL